MNIAIQHLKVYVLHVSLFPTKGHNYNKNRQAMNENNGRRVCVTHVKGSTQCCCWYSAMRVIEYVFEGGSSSLLNKGVFSTAFILHISALCSRLAETILLTALQCCITVRDPALSTHTE